MTDAGQPDQEGRRSAAGESPPGVPRWVKALAVVALILLLVLLVAMLAGGNHGPSRHRTDGATEPHCDPVTVASTGLQHEGSTAW